MLKTVGPLSQEGLSSEACVNKPQSGRSFQKWHLCLRPLFPQGPPLGTARSLQQMGNRQACWHEGLMASELWEIPLGISRKMGSLENYL